ncbi:MAG: hypothetical protein IR153_01145 [Flavobacterium sp.]|nr:hypothetical protein [Flavobacterium sp.]
MKYILFFAFATFSLSASAQQNSGTTTPDDNQDRLQQEPPRTTQQTVERSADRTSVNTTTTDRNAATSPNRSDMNTNNSTNVQQVLKNEVEQSTGKESENPAVTNPRTVKPARLSDPVSKPVQPRN